MALLDRATTVGDAPKFVKGLIYGEPGVGKTHFCGFAPTPFFIDDERSTDTLSTIPELKDTVKTFKPKSFQEVIDVTKEVYRSKKYETIVFDTISRIQTNQLTQRAKLKGREDNLPWQNDYRLSTAVMDAFFVDLQDMDINILFVAHAKTHVDEESGKITKIRPDLTPGLAKALVGLINVVGYLEVTSGLGGMKRTMRVNPTTLIVAKNRLGITEPVIQDPTFKGIFK